VNTHYFPLWRNLTCLLDTQESRFGRDAAGAQEIRTPYRQVFDFLKQWPGRTGEEGRTAKRLFMSQGITFTVYTGGEGIEKIFRSTSFRDHYGEEWNHRVASNND